MHLSGSARSGAPPDRPVASVPPPPPRWRNWLLGIGLLLTAALFLVPIPTSSNVEQWGYSQLKTDIAAGQVASVALGPDGSVSGQLTNGTKFTSSYPVTLQDPQFAQLLDQHNAAVSTQPARTSAWSVLLNLLPLAIIVALFVWSGRATRRQLAGMGGLVGPGPDVDLEVVARGTPGFSGADLANLVNEAATFAVRAGRQLIEAEDFAEARDRVLLGRRDSSNALLPQEKHAVAVHESGHALVAVLSEHGDPVATWATKVHG